MCAQMLAMMLNHCLVQLMGSGSYVKQHFTNPRYWRKLPESEVKCFSLWPLTSLYPNPSKRNSLCLPLITIFNPYPHINATSNIRWMDLILWSASTISGPMSTPSSRQLNTPHHMICLPLPPIQLMHIPHTIRIPSNNSHLYLSCKTPHNMKDLE